MCPRVGAHQQKYPRERIFFMVLASFDKSEIFTEGFSSFRQRQEVFPVILIIFDKGKMFARDFNNRIGFGTTSSEFSTNAKFFHNITQAVD